jgi:hypothetical protein
LLLLLLIELLLLLIRLLLVLGRLLIGLLAPQSNPFPWLGGRLAHIRTTCRHVRVDLLLGQLLPNPTAAASDTRCLQCCCAAGCCFSCHWIWGCILCQIC